MKQFWKRAWEIWLKIGFFIGNIVSFTVLVVFYYSFFALFAIVFRFSRHPLRSIGHSSNWLERNKVYSAVKDFEHEF